MEQNEYEDSTVWNQVALGAAANKLQTTSEGKITKIEQVKDQYEKLTGNKWPRQVVKLIPSAHASDPHRVEPVGTTTAKGPKGESSLAITAAYHWQKRKDGTWGRQTREEWYQQFPELYDTKSKFYEGWYLWSCKMKDEDWAQVYLEAFFRRVDHSEGSGMAKCRADFVLGNPISDYLSNPDLTNFCSGLRSIFRYTHCRRICLGCGTFQSLDTFKQYSHLCWFVLNSQANHNEDDAALAKENWEEFFALEKLHKQEVNELTKHIQNLLEKDLRDGNYEVHLNASSRGMELFFHDSNMQLRVPNQFVGGYQQQEQRVLKLNGKTFKTASRWRKAFSQRIAENNPTVNAPATPLSDIPSGEQAPVRQQVPQPQAWDSRSLIGIPAAPPPSVPQNGSSSSAQILPSGTAESVYEFEPKGLKLTFTAETLKSFEDKDLEHEPLTYKVEIAEGIFCLLVLAHGQAGLDQACSELAATAIRETEVTEYKIDPRHKKPLQTEEAEYYGRPQRCSPRLKTKAPHDSAMKQKSRIKFEQPIGVMTNINSHELLAQKPHVHVSTKGSSTLIVASKTEIGDQDKIIKQESKRSEVDEQQKKQLSIEKNLKKRKAPQNTALLEKELYESNDRNLSLTLSSSSDQSKGIQKRNNRQSSCSRLETILLEGGQVSELNRDAAFTDKGRSAVIRNSSPLPSPLGLECTPTGPASIGQNFDVLDKHFEEFNRKRFAMNVSSEKRMLQFRDAEIKKIKFNKKTLNLFRPHE